MDRLWKIFFTQIGWSSTTFGDASERDARGPANHLKREVNEELLEDVTDINEMADCFILLIDMLWRSGYNIDDMLEAIERKQRINIAREWQEPDSEGVFEHKKEKE